MWDLPFWAAAVSACCFGLLGLLLFVVLQGPKQDEQTIVEKWTRQQWTRGADYDVFLSHAGEQKTGFVDHLDAAFARRYKNVRVFLDEKRLKVGAVPEEAIDNAMLGAPVAIIVLSPEFVRKKYPMYELEFLLEGHRQGKVTLVPVLYSLAYSDTQDMMAAYKSQPWVSKETRPLDGVLKRWATNVKALLDITAIRKDQFRGEAGLVDGVVDTVVPHLRAAGRAVVRHPGVQLKENTVGLEQRREELVALLRQHGMVLLHGMAGVGKTTLANSTYDLLSETEFGAAVCVRMAFNASTSREELKGQQRAVLQQLGREVLLVDAQHGQRELVTALSGKRVLLLVDNVWNDQLSDALPADIMQVLAGTQSMVLVTSRDTTVAEEFKPKPFLKEMLPLPEADARQLFYNWAFRPDESANPPADKGAIAAMLLTRCNGLPFAIEVIAKYLTGKPIGDWRRWEENVQEAFERQKALRIGEDKTLFAALKVSYDFLEPAEQALMLDIAFLIRNCGRSARALQTNYSRVPYTAEQLVVGFSWELLEAYGGPRLELLLSRGLIQRMDCGHPYGHEANLHDAVMALSFSQLLEGCMLNGDVNSSSLIVPMDEVESRRAELDAELQDASCTHLAAQERQEVGWGELRRWLATARPLAAQQGAAAACRVLWIDRAVWTDKVSDIRWPVSQNPLALRMGVTQQFSELQLLCFSAPSWPQVSLPDNVLRSFPKLRFLYLRDITNAVLNLQGLTRLRKLVLERASGLEALVGWEDLGRLEVLEITYCNRLLIQNLQGMAYLRTFKVMQAGNLPDLGSLRPLKNLETLYLWGLGTLTSLQGLSSLTALESLTVAMCDNLAHAADLPRMAYLTHLNISFCKSFSSMGDVASTFHRMQALTINDCPLVSLPPLGRLPNLAKVNILNCPELLAYPDLHGATAVKDLSVLACNSLTSLPGLQELTGVTQLFLSCKSLVTVPNLAALCNLQKLIVTNCHSLQQLPTPLCLPALTELNLQDCASLSTVPDIASISPSLQRLVIRDCPSLPTVPGLTGAPGLTSVQIASCNALTSVSDLDRCTALKEFEIRSCGGLAQIKGFGRLPALQSLKLEWCNTLAALPDLTGLPQLRLLDLNSCALVQELPGLGALPQLVHLKLRACGGLTALTGLSGLTALHELSVVWGHQLLRVQGLEALRQLRDLALLDCPKLEAVPDLCNLSELHDLNLEDIPCLAAMPWVPQLTSLETMLVRRCSNLQVVGDVSALGHLSYLEVVGCGAVTRINGLEARWPHFRRRVIHGCPALRGLPAAIAAPPASQAGPPQIIVPSGN